MSSFFFFKFETTLNVHVINGSTNYFEQIYLWIRNQIKIVWIRFGQPSVSNKTLTIITNWFTIIIISFSFFELWVVLCVCVCAEWGSSLAQERKK